MIVYKWNSIIWLILEAIMNNHIVFTWVTYKKNHGWVIMYNMWLFRGNHNLICYCGKLICKVYVDNIFCKNILELIIKNFFS